MLILGIESSCDETGAALVRDGRYLLSNVVASQIDIHNRYGGVVPEVASRQQIASIIPVIEAAMQQASCRWEEVDAIAATYGPGLAGSLLVGLTVGKTLALAQKLPFIGVNHLEAHLYANWLRAGDGQLVGTDWRVQEGDPLFPLLALVISGAHSELVLVHEHGSYELLGQTRDDAAGEAFDKVSRILGLGYPGGPAIQKMAQQAEDAYVQQQKSVNQARKAYRLPRAWIRGTYDFSFSGVKTAMLNLAEGASRSMPAEQRAATQVTQYTRMGEQAAQHGELDVALLASSFQEAIVDVLAVKTRLAAEEFRVKQVILAGGVAANLSLRQRMAQELKPLGVRLSYPPIDFCTDNAAMIGSAAFFHLALGERHGFDLDVQPGLSLPFKK
ncbi:tRNA (adenosine(37)-N6)-threonylcarbamoyltransferase complex transferase subunit TsaD [Tengunoibacter tsumagoiensis]|uniref:tRNA N6-adenosine threonylcarbamoyltransferase n=1 Tax=Tengunoibacter tsumagoiensis TaxID=2014871 RepID=A0A402A1Y8_9CHLR|nr:tRNA (adenosine(37)-N6)-threonylcarbamoyltransferase complex transferase subunit TsaD [Tengunoibacter tsumagoiensis]GCE13167.1 tRNA N6-adenosine threonylcarbamoyltransferase [Tengunoibacter tsumagoiensis]